MIIELHLLYIDATITEMLNIEKIILHKLQVMMKSKNCFNILLPIPMSPETTPKNTMQIAQDIIAQYDVFIEEWVQELTDEQIDSLLWTQDTMLWLLDVFVLKKKIYAQRRLLAEKEEKKCEQFVWRIMRRLQLHDYECKDWKVVPKIKREFTVDMKELPEEYHTHNRNTIHALVDKKVSVPGVTPGTGHLSFSVK